MYIYIYIHVYSQQMKSDNRGIISPAVMHKCRYANRVPAVHSQQSPAGQRKKGNGFPCILELPAYHNSCVHVSAIHT